MSYAVDSRSLEAVTRHLPPPAMDSFVKAANEMADNGGDHNDCIKAGWDCVKAEGWHKPADGKRWIMKDNPGPADVHVPGPVNSQPSARRKKKKPLMIDGYAGDDEESDLGDRVRVTRKGDTFESAAEVCKVDSSLGLVFGYAIVCTKNGQPYFDLQGDHIPDDSMLKAATDFMTASRMSGDMHARDEAGEPVGDGQVVFAFPMTQDIAKALEIETPQTGLLIAMKPSADVLAKYVDGTYTGFSIGGARGEDEEVAEAV